MKNKFSIIITLFLFIPIFGQGGDGSGCAGTDPDGALLTGRDDNCQPNPFRLVFHDEFNGNKLDLKFWKYLTGLPTGDKEYEYYQPENVEVSNGLLKIISKKESLGSKTWSFWNGTTMKMENKTGTFDFTSGYVISQYKFPYAYGKFEARIKIPNSNSCRPAFWLYGDNSNEIDIFEFFEDKATMTCTIHDDIENNGSEKSCRKNIYLPNNSSFSDDFHIYSVVWNPWFIEFYLDGVPKWTYSRWKTILTQDIRCPYSVGNYLRRSVYADNPLEIKLSTKISDNTLSNSVQMEVDWVRVYYELPCQDVTITNPSNIPQVSGMYNFIFGKNVNINCNYNISQDKPLAIIGSKNIEIRGNINASDGYFYSGIDASSDCDGQSVRPLDLLNDSNNLQLNSITVFPNPIDYDQLLNFTYKLNNSNTCIELNIFDGHGQIIEKANLKNGPNFSYKIIAKLPAGIYYGILELPDGFRKYFKVQKI